MIAQFFVLLLYLDAAVVAAGLIKKRNMWPFIVLYWILLTIKNCCDLAGV